MRLDCQTLLKSPP